MTKRISSAGGPGGVPEDHPVSPPDSSPVATPSPNSYEGPQSFQALIATFASSLKTGWRNTTGLWAPAADLDLNAGQVLADWQRLVAQENLILATRPLTDEEQIFMIRAAIAVLHGMQLHTTEDEDLFCVLANMTYSRAINFGDRILAEEIRDYFEIKAGAVDIVLPVETARSRVLEKMIDRLHATASGPAFMALLESLRNEINEWANLGCRQVSCELALCIASSIKPHQFSLFAAGQALYHQAILRGEIPCQNPGEYWSLPPILRAVVEWRYDEEIKGPRLEIVRSMVPHLAVHIPPRDATNPPTPETLTLADRVVSDLWKTAATIFRGEKVTSITVERFNLINYLLTLELNANANAAVGNVSATLVDLALEMLEAVDHDRLSPKFYPSTFDSLPWHRALALFIHRRAVFGGLSNQARQLKTLAQEKLGLDWGHDDSEAVQTIVLEMAEEIFAMLEGMHQEGRMFFDVVNNHQRLTSMVAAAGALPIAHFLNLLGWEWLEAHPTADDHLEMDHAARQETTRKIMGASLKIGLTTREELGTWVALWRLKKHSSGGGGGTPTSGNLGGKTGGAGGDIVLGAPARVMATRPAGYARVTSFWKPLTASSCSSIPRALIPRGR